MVRIFKAIIILIISSASLPAQVKLLLDYNARTDEYTVSMMPERTWSYPKNKTATGQITLKATTGQFEVKEIVSHVANTKWGTAGRVNHPIESPKYDYIFFRLRTPGLTEMPYKAFKPTKLFTFTLESNCAREVMLVNNEEDPFLPPNSRNVNIGNSLGALGANGEAYIGNISDLPIFCPYAAAPALAEESATSDSKIVEPTSENTSLLTNKLLYPNPTVKEVQVTLKWNGTAGKRDVLAYNSAGELVKYFQRDIQKGDNNFTLDIGNFDNGIYNFLLVDDQQNLTLGKVIKVQ